MKSIGIIAKIQHSKTKEVLTSLVKWLEARKIKVVIDNETSEILGYSSDIFRANIPSMVDMIIVLGGDGTLISVARLIENEKVPILGVNLGSLGFLTEVYLDELYPCLEKILSGDYTTDERIKLNANIVREGKRVGLHTALNDIVINRGALARIIELEVYINDLYVARYRADGLIISTPTGSTAYLLAADGPIVYPTLNAFVIAPICPHALSNRPIVIPDDGKITVKLLTQNEDVLATIDGQIGFALNYRDTITITKSENATLLIRSPNKNYYQILREKLRWGERIGHFQDNTTE